MEYDICSILILHENDKLCAELKKIDFLSCNKTNWIRAKSFDSGVKLCAQKTPDVVILSLELSGLTSNQILKAWFNEKFDIPTIAILQKTDNKLIERAFNFGVTDYLINDEHLPILLDRVVTSALMRRKLVKRVDELETKVENFVENCGVAIITADPKNGKIFDVNEQALELYGYSRDEFIGKSIQDLMLSDPPREDKTSGFWISEPDVQLEKRRVLHLTKDDEIRYVQTRKVDLVISGKPSIALVVEDLTAFKQQEEEILFLQQFNTNILNNLPFSIMVKTENRVVTYQNKTSFEIFGHLVGQSVEQAAEDREDLQVLNEVEKRLNLKDPSREARLEWEDKIYSVSAILISDVRTDSRLIVELARDVTDQETVQVELFKAQRMEAVGNLAGGIAHDFNNLLSGILGYANLIQALVEDNEQILQYADIIEETCSRASDLTQQLLQFSRHKTLTNERFNLNDIARYAGKLLRHSMKKEIPLIQRLTKKKLTIKGDPAQVQQMIINLCLNANETMTEGEVTLRSKEMQIEEDSELAKNGLKPGLYGVLNIEDTGRAVDAESVISIMEPNFTPSSEGEPVGLGVSVAHAIIRSHSGSIVVEPNDIGGLTVTVYLPIAPEKDTGKTEEPAEAVRGNETILVIDDEQVIRNLLQTSLSNLGYRVLLAKGGNEGLKIYGLFKADIDLVLLDLGLPGMDGKKVFDLIRIVNPEAKVVLFTGADSKKQSRELIKDGAMAWASKPISIKMLSKTMRSVLDGKTKK